MSTVKQQWSVKPLKTCKPACTWHRSSTI